jgi:hypothetical protein
MALAVPVGLPLFAATSEPVCLIGGHQNASAAFRGIDRDLKLELLGLVELSVLVA